MPLSNVGARNNYKAGKVTLKQLLLQLKQLEQNVMVQIDNAVKQAQSDYESVEAQREARIYAEAALDAEQKTYAVGKSHHLRSAAISKHPDQRAPRKSARSPITTKPRQSGRRGRQHARTQWHRPEPVGSAIFPFTDDFSFFADSQNPSVRSCGKSCARRNGVHGLVDSRPHQKCHAPRQTIHTPSRRLVMACAVIASPSRFLRMTSH